MEVFYTFTWAGNRGQRRGGGKPRREAASGGGARGKGRPPGKGKPAQGTAGGTKKFESRPPKKDKQVDPDNPFAVLASLKNKS